MNTNKLRGIINPIQERIQSQRDITPTSQTISLTNSSKSGSMPSTSVIKPPTNSKVSSTLAPSIGSNPFSGTLFPVPNSSQRAGARSKVKLEPGHSPLDWAHLNSSGKNLRGINPSDLPIYVTNEILKMHKTQDDCWTVLSGKVYNITAYMKFHPGGVDELMKCAGKDGTSLFMKYHAWVNFERMLENCLVGFYIG